jgi:5-methylcytosine-specific restriction enzyme A
MNGHEFVLPAKRKTHSDKVRREVWIREKGVCHIGHHKIMPGTPWHLEHPHCLQDGGSDDPSDLKLACERCHRRKTSRENARRAKERQVFDKHFGIWQPKSPPLPGCRRSKWKHKICGEWLRRQSPETSADIQADEAPLGSPQEPRPD